MVNIKQSAKVQNEQKERERKKGPRKKEGKKREREDKGRKESKREERGGGIDLWLLHHTLEVGCMDGPYIGMLAIIHRSSDVWIVFRCIDSIPMYGLSIH